MKFDFTDGENPVQDIYWAISAIWESQRGSEIDAFVLIECIPRSTIITFLNKFDSTAQSTYSLELATLIPVLLAEKRAGQVLDGITHGDPNAHNLSDADKYRTTISNCALEYNRARIAKLSKEETVRDLEYFDILSFHIFGRHLDPRFLLKYGYPQDVIDETWR